MEIDPSPRSSLIGFVEGTQLDATAITFVDLAPSLSLSLSPSLPSFLSQSLYQSQELPPTRYSYRLNGFLSLYLSLSPSLPPPPPPPPPPLPSFSPCLRLYHDFSFTCLFLPLSLLPSVGDRGVSFRSRGEGSRSREISSSWEGRGAGKRKKKKREKERKEADITH